MCMKCIQSGIVALQLATKGKPIPGTAEIEQLVDQSCQELETGNMVLAQLHGGRPLPPEELATFRAGISEYTAEYWRDFLSMEDAANIVARTYVARPSMATIARAAGIVDDAAEVREMVRRADRGLPPLTLHAHKINRSGPGSFAEADGASVVSFVSQNGTTLH